jgi:RNAse (barnase) inhibitor barstar
MTYEAILQDPAKSGVRRLPTDAEAIARAAVTIAFALWRVDLTAVRNKAALLAVLARAIEFPDWFGKNWDALLDCLGDLSWRPAPGYVLILEHCGVFAKHAPKDYVTALEVFNAAADSWRERGVPFWVFLGGIDVAQSDLPGMNTAK